MTDLVRDLDAIAGGRFDVVIIGGGITGAGAARHAAAAGLSTLLLEAGDFAAGTSGRSTKLIHGGLRYLAMGDVALVREGALERKNLARMAPHLAQPRWMVIPAGSRTAMLKLRAGVALYEKLGAVSDADQHQNWNARQLAKAEPLLDRTRYPYACVYREYLTDDARLVLATLRAAAAHGATVANYVRVTALNQDAAGCTLVVCDEVDGRQLEVRAAAVVNATGPWVESLLSQAGQVASETPHRLHLSKGVHLIFPSHKLPVRNMVMMTAADGRPVFAIPRGAVTYVGTTDTTWNKGPVLWPEVEPEDVRYLLAPLAEHFSGQRLTEADVVGSWAGLRPLIDQPGKAPKEISRRDEIWRDGRLLTIAGGKLTGFRLMAEETLAAVGSVLGRQLVMADPLEPLPGGAFGDLAALVREAERRYQVESPVAERLVRLYGAEVFTVLGERPQPISASVFAEEVRWAVRAESAVHLEDLLYRRLRVPWFQPDEADEVLRRGADIMAQAAGWSAERSTAELAAARLRLAGDRTAFESQALAS